MTKMSILIVTDGRQAKEIMLPVKFDVEIIFINVH